MDGKKLSSGEINSKKTHFVCNGKGILLDLFGAYEE